MNTKLNLDEYDKNTELTLKGIKYLIPPITYKVRNDLMNIFNEITNSKDEEAKRNADLTLIIAYLNTNLDKVLFTIEELESKINAYQINMLTEFILNQIRGIEKN